MRWRLALLCLSSDQAEVAKVFSEKNLELGIAVPYLTQFCARCLGLRLGGPAVFAGAEVVGPAVGAAQEDGEHLSGARFSRIITTELRP